MIASRSRTLYLLGALSFCVILGSASRVYATGVDADSMCTPVYPQCPCHQDPDPVTGKCMPGGQNKFMCPPGPDICEDTTNGHITTGTCDRPNHCLTNTCGGKECKQPKPGAPQPQQPQDKQGQDQKGQGGQPPQMPKPPQGGGGKPQSQPQDQQNSGNCAFSSALGIPCTPAVSSQLGSGSNGGNPDAAQALEKLSALEAPNQDAGDASPQSGTPETGSPSFGQELNTAISHLFSGLTGAPPASGGTQGDTSADQSGVQAGNATGFSAPAASAPARNPSFLGRALSWFSSLFGH